VLLAHLEKLDYSGECKRHLHLSKSIADGLENWASNLAIPDGDGL
jgi:hypothetical protein